MIDLLLWLQHTAAPWSFYIAGTLFVVLVGLTCCAVVLIHRVRKAALASKHMPFTMMALAGSVSGSLIVLMGLLWATEMCLLWMGVQL